MEHVGAGQRRSGGLGLLGPLAKGARVGFPCWTVKECRKALASFGLVLVVAVFSSFFGKVGETPKPGGKGGVYVLHQEVERAPMILNFGVEV